MSTLQDRFREAMAPPCTITAADLARECRIKPPSVHEWLYGPTKTLKGPNAIRAARLLGVNPEWLSTGRGPMRNRLHLVGTPVGPTDERRASDDVIALRLGMRALVMTVLNRLPGTAEPFSDLLKTQADEVDFLTDAGLVATLLGIAREAHDAEEAANQALRRAGFGAHTKPKK